MKVFFPFFLFLCTCRTWNHCKEKGYSTNESSHLCLHGQLHPWMHGRNAIVCIHDYYDDYYCHCQAPCDTKIVEIKVAIKSQSNSVRK